MTITRSRDATRCRYLAVAMALALLVALSWLSPGSAQEEPPEAPTSVDVDPGAEPVTPAPTVTLSPTAESLPTPPTTTPTPGRQVVFFPNSQRPWDKIPRVVISATDGDPRIPLVRDAVVFWNAQLEALGSPFRLGPVVQTAELLPSDYLLARSEAGLTGQPLPPFPDSVLRMPGDLIVALSDGDFVSFAFTRYPFPQGKYLVGIRGGHLFPLTLPNVARNVIAHELGHAIGLGHNDDPGLLMCGRPAPCRPDAFRSDEERFFPLAEEEKAFLLMLYPPGWRATR